jgi:hypothetical protein
VEGRAVCAAPCDCRLIPFREITESRRPRRHVRVERVHLSGAERSELESQARRYTSSYYSVLRAKIILLAAEGVANDAIGARLSVPRQIVSKWRKRFFKQRTSGLQDEARSGRPPAFSP